MTAGGQLVTSQMPAPFSVLWVEHWGFEIAWDRSHLRSVGFSSRGTWAPVAVARGLSCCGSWALEHRLSSCGAWAWLLCGIWNLPGPEIEPSPLH